MIKQDQTLYTTVFFSYSRKDLFIVKKLKVILDDGGIKYLFDTKDTIGGEDWWVRINQLITESDSVLVLLSNNFCRSRVCLDELDIALSQNKRVIPVLLSEINWDLVPGQARKLHAIDYSGLSFESFCESLITTITTNIGWVREHTRLGGHAQLWVKAKSDDLLLRGSALRKAQQWLEAGLTNGEKPSLGHMKYINASEVAEKSRQTFRLKIVFIAALVSVFLSAWAISESRKAKENEILAKNQLALTEIEQGQNSKDEGENLLKAKFHFRRAAANSNESHIIKRAILSEQLLPFSQTFESDLIENSIEVIENFDNLLVGWSSNNEIYIYDIYERKIVLNKKIEIAERFFIKDIILSKNKLHLAIDANNTISKRDTVLFYSLSESEIIWEEEFGEYDDIAGLQFDSRSGNLVVRGRFSFRATAKIYDPFRDNMVVEFEHHKTSNNFITQIEFVGESQTAVSIAGNSLAYWDISNGETLFEVEIENSKIETMDLNYDLSSVITGTGYSINVWSLYEKKLIKRLEGHDYIVAKTKNLVVTRDYENQIRVYDSSTGVLEKQFQPDFLGNISGFSLDSSDTHLVIWSDRGLIEVWDLEKQLLKLSLSHTGVDSVYFDSSMLVSISNENEIKVWDWTRNQFLFRAIHSNSIIFTKWLDENSLISLSSDGKWKVSKAPEIPFIGESVKFYSIGNNTPLFYETNGPTVVVATNLALHLINIDSEKTAMKEISGIIGIEIINDMADFWAWTKDGEITKFDSKLAQVKTCDNLKPYLLNTESLGSENSDVSYASITERGLFLEVPKNRKQFDLRFDFVTGFGLAVLYGESSLLFSLDTCDLIAQVNHDGLTDSLITEDGAFILSWGKDGTTRMTSTSNVDNTSVFKSHLYAWDNDDPQSDKAYPPIEGAYFEPTNAEVFAWPSSFKIFKWSMSETKESEHWPGDSFQIGVNIDSVTLLADGKNHVIRVREGKLFEKNRLLLWNTEHGSESTIYESNGSFSQLEINEYSASILTSDGKFLVYNLISNKKILEKNVGLDVLGFDMPSNKSISVFWSDTGEVTVFSPMLESIILKHNFGMPIYNAKVVGREHQKILFFTQLGFFVLEIPRDSDILHLPSEKDLSNATGMKLNNEGKLIAIPDNLLD